MEISRPSSAPVFRPLFLRARSEAYAPSLDSAERATAAFSEDLERQAGLRKRQRCGLDDDGERTDETASSASLTPGFVSEHEEVTARLTLSDRLRGLFARLLTRPSFENKKQLDEDPEYIKVEKQEDFVLGIPQLAYLQDSDDSFSFGRRFGRIAMRIIINKQIELQTMGERLDQLDLADEQTESLRYRLHCIDDHVPDSEKSKLLETLETKIDKYYDLFLKYTEMRSLTKVSTRDHRSVQHYHAWEKPLENGLEAYSKVLHDLAFAKSRHSQGSQHRNVFEEYFESGRAKYPKSLFNKLSRDSSKPFNPGLGANADYTSTRFRTTFSNIAAAVSAIAIMLPPVFLMFLLHIDRQAMAWIVGGFVLVFMLLMAAVADMTQMELFLCVAAYLAILVAILGSKMSQGGSCPSDT